MWEAISEVVGTLLQRERHGDVRTYVGETVVLFVAVSRRARATIRSEGNRLWVWSESVNREYGLIRASTLPPAGQQAYLLLRDEADAGGFELMLDSTVDPNGLLVRRRLWPFRGVTVMLGPINA
jgi:hypothetical protein